MSVEVGKRVLVAGRTNSYSSKSESEDEEVANLCLMSRENIQESNQYEEVTLAYLLTLIKEYLA